MKFFEIISQSFQSIYDLAIQQYGSIDYVDILLKDNPSINLSTDIPVGTIIKIRQDMAVADEATKKYFVESGKKVATWDNDGVAPSYTPVTIGAINIQINTTPFLIGITSNQDIPVKNTNDDNLGAPDGGVWRIGDAIHEIQIDGVTIATINYPALTNPTHNIQW